MLQLASYSNIKTVIIFPTLTIYKGIHIPSQNTVQLRVSSAVDKIQKAALLEEAQTLTSLKGIKGIPNILNHGFTQSLQYFVVTEWTGSSIAQIIEQKQSLGIKSIIYIGQQLLEILEKVHEKNLFHLHISPQNVYINNEGKSKVYLQGFCCQQFQNINGWNQRKSLELTRLRQNSVGKTTTENIRNDLASIGKFLTTLLTYEFNQKLKISTHLIQNLITTRFQQYFFYLSKFPNQITPSYVFLQKLIYKLITDLQKGEESLKSLFPSDKLNRQKQKKQLSTIKEVEEEQFVSKQHLKYMFINNLDVLHSLDSASTIFEVPDEECPLSNHHHIILEGLDIKTKFNLNN